MIYILKKQGKVVGATEVNPGTGTPSLKVLYREDGTDIDYDNYVDRWDITSFEEVEAYVADLKAISDTNYIACDSGPNVSPRYSVSKMFRIGEEVSMSFNGDTYPVGKVARITKGLMVVTDKGDKFNRYKKTGGWFKIQSPFCLVRGNMFEQNPHF